MTRPDLAASLAHLERLLGDVTHYVKALPDRERQALEEDGADEVLDALETQRATVVSGGDVDDDRDKLLAALLLLLLAGAAAGGRTGVEDLGALGIVVEVATVLTRAEAWARDYAPRVTNLINTTSRERVAAAVEAGLEGDALGAALDSIFGPERALLIAVTEATTALTEGALVAYDEGDVVKIKWVTAHDEKVCPVCAPLDGQVALIGEGFDGVDGPPAHPRCRCTLEPVV